MLDQKDRDMLCTVAEWATMKRFDDLARATVNKMEELGVAFSDDLKMRLELRAIVAECQVLDYGSEHQKFSHLVERILPTEALAEASDAGPKAWFKVVRALVKQGAVALLAQQFLADNIVEVSSLDDISIPKRFKLETLVSQMKGYLNKNAAVYQTHKAKLDVDIDYFTSSGFMRKNDGDNKKRGGKKVAPLSDADVPDKDLLFDIFAQNDIAEFKAVFAQYFQSLEAHLDQKAADARDQVLGSARDRALGRACRTDVEVEGGEEGPYLWSPVRKAVQAAQATPSQVKPGKLSAQIKMLDKKYDELDPLKEAMGSRRSSRRNSKLFVVEEAPEPAAKEFTTKAPSSKRATGKHQASKVVAVEVEEESKRIMRKRPAPVEEAFHENDFVDLEPGRKRAKWSEEEIDALLRGIERHGTSNWAEILRDNDFYRVLYRRDNINLKDKYRTLQQQGLIQ